MDVLDSVVELAKRDPAVTLARVNKLAPIIDVISEFTDGDEMDHVRSKFIEVVAEVASGRLFSLYEHHLSNDEYRYADECLIEFMKTVELESREGAALGRTLLDERTLGVLERRAANELTAQALLDRQNSFLGRTPRPCDELNAKLKLISNHQNEASAIDPTSFGSDDLEFAARYYADRWQQYIEDTSVPAPYYRRRGFGLVLGYKYLVRFLMLVGQTNLADAVTTMLVDTLVEDVRDQPIPEALWFH
jgi:hypothetical protein